MWGLGYESSFRHISWLQLVLKCHIVAWPRQDTLLHLFSAYNSKKKLDVVLGEMSGHLGESFGRKKVSQMTSPKKFPKRFSPQNVGILFLWSFWRFRNAKRVCSESDNPC